MTEAEWLACEDSPALLVYLKIGSGRAKLRKVTSRRGCERKSRLFLVACARRNWSLLQDHRSREAVEVAERFADASADVAELEAARDAAWAAYQAVRSLPNPAVYCAANIAVEAAQVTFSQGFSQSIHGAGIAALAPASKGNADTQHAYDEQIRVLERSVQATFLRDILGNLFRPVTFSSVWRTDTAVSLARQMYESRDFSAMPIVADALQDAGCDSADILDHCRRDGPHVRGCWVVDLVLGKE